jgi:phosphoenolpyruvate carboxykinase (ATP)
VQLLIQENIQDDPLDRFIVKDSITEDQFGGESEYSFEQLLKHCTKVTSLSNKEVFIRDSYVCADPNYRLNVRVLTETP